MPATSKVPHNRAETRTEGGHRSPTTSCLRRAPSKQPSKSSCVCKLRPRVRQHRLQRTMATTQEQSGVDSPQLPKAALLTRPRAVSYAAAAAASRAACRAPMQQQLARSGVMPTCVTRFAKAVSIVRSWWLFQLPRAARLRKKWPGMGQERAAFPHEEACSRTGGGGLARQCDRARSIALVCLLSQSRPSCETDTP